MRPENEISVDYVFAIGIVHVITYAVIKMHFKLAFFVKQSINAASVECILIVAFNPFTKMVIVEINTISYLHGDETPPRWTV